jgi:hypothetical protein
LKASHPDPGWLAKGLIEEIHMHPEVKRRRRIPWYVLPFWWIWQLLALIVGMTGRLVAILLGLVLMIAGVLVSVTIVGLIVGIPLILFGVLLIIRGLF